MLLRQTLLYLPAQVMGPLFQVISAFAWTHFLAPDEMGTLALVTAAQELAFSLLLLWFSLYTVRYLDAGAPDEQRRRFHATEGAILALALAVSAAALIFVPIGVSGVLTGQTLIAGLAFVLSRSLVSYLAERTRAEGDTLAYTVLQTAGPVAGFFLAWGLIRILPDTAATVMWGYAIAQMASVLYAVRRTRIGLDVWNADPTLVRKALTYGLPLVLGGMFVWVANNSIRFLIEWREGLAAVGLVTVGWALGLRAAQFASMLTTAAAFPLAVRRFREEGPAAGQAQLERNAVLLLAVVTPALAGLLLISRPLIELIVAEPYRAVTIDVLPLALLAGGLRNIRVHGPNQAYLLHGNPMRPVLIDGIDAALTAVFAFAGLMLGGVKGAVAGVTLSAVVTLGIALWSTWRDYRFTLPAVDSMRIAVAAALMAAAVHWTEPSPSLLSLAIAVATGALVYGVALAALYPAMAGTILAMVHRRLRRAPGTAPPT
ncbi:MAG: polysaccharide biosynthesis C-terminal domain-containing protein [Hyphomicrobiaceae bacterium]|nr:polysaccharide biosynthesis C-terminal domain-containing protein [Hyphomicrobiaceae bacterium]